MAGNSLWRLPRFRNLWLAQTVSLVGTQVTLVALPLAAIGLGASAFDVGLLSACEFLPVLLLGLPAGAWVERRPRRQVLLFTDAVRAVALAAVPFAYALDLLTLPLLFAAAFVVGVGTLFFDVACMSFLPALVDEERLAESNAKLEGSRSFAQLGGPTVGGFLIGLFGAPVAVLVDAVSYAGSFALLLSVRGRDTSDGDGRAAPTQEDGGGTGGNGRGLRREIGEGVRFISGHPVLRSLAVCDATANFGFGVLLALQVLYADAELGLSAAEIGVVLAVGNVGGLGGALLVGSLSRWLPPRPLLVGSIAVFTAGTVLLPLAAGEVVFGAGLFVVYAGVVIYNVVILTLRQLVTPEWLLGRVNATLRFIEWGTLPFGALLGGLVAGPLGLRGVLWLTAAFCALSVLPPLRAPLNGMDRETATKVVSS